MTLIFRQCNKCNVLKNLHTDFNKASNCQTKHDPVGHDYRCKQCRSRVTYDKTVYRKCSTCKVIKLLNTDFYSCKSHPTKFDPIGRMHECIVCSRQRALRRRLALKYGMPLKEYELLIKKQNGKCRICQKSPKNGLLCVDHNHTTNQNRGLLCKACNLGLGNFYDRVELLEAAIIYLKETQ